MTTLAKPYVEDVHDIPNNAAANCSLENAAGVAIACRTTACKRGYVPILLELVLVISKSLRGGHDSIRKRTRW